MAEGTVVNIAWTLPTGDPHRVKVAHTSLPLSEIETGERRLEGERYLLGGYALARRVKAAPSAALADFADVWQPGRLKGITVSSEHGVPFFTATQVFDIRPFARKWLAPLRTYDLEKRYVEPGWILVTCSGTVGETIIGYSPLAGVIISHDLLRIQVRNRAHLGYIYGFLRSRFARSMLVSDQYGSIIKHLEPEHAQKLPVPLPAEDAYDPLTERVRTVYRLRDQAFHTTVEAEAAYSAHVGADIASRPVHDTYLVTASDLLNNRRRLDAFHYNPTSEWALRALRGTGRAVVPLSSLHYRVFEMPRFKRPFAPTGVPYLDSEDLFKVNPRPSKFISQAQKSDAADYFVKRGWILMACSGQIYGLNGRVLLADDSHENKVISEHAIRIVPPERENRVLPGYIQMALGHSVFGRPLVLRWAFGTEVPEIQPEDLKDFPVARLGDDVEAEIAEQVSRASVLRRQADEEENAVVRHVEQMVAKTLGVG
jgi:hypothetical protein